MRVRNFIYSIALLAALPLASVSAGDWETYKAPDYGFSMLVPTGAALETKEWPGGWGGLRGHYEGVTFFSVAKLGAQEPPEAIEAFGVQLTGIPASAWSEFDGGADKGWQGYRAVQAHVGSKFVFGGYGIGPKGSYLILLETTPADFEANRADYESWYDSVRLH